MERLSGPLRPKQPGLGYSLKRSTYELLPSLVKRASIATESEPGKRICTGNLERKAFNLSACLELLPGAALIYQGFTNQSPESTAVGTYLFSSGLSRSLIEISRDTVDQENIQRDVFAKRRPGTIGLEALGILTKGFLDKVDEIKSKREYIP